ncbi:outer membrane beta-barrel protein [Gilvimarinus xylanilyticus]|uniref:Outer membrane beta-barrel protein n=1 Tax=Gilvimarinus xylanilyticus TaxID=2944139 RepID=A0A9X2KTE9_9GAMM|nr:outer membrane beta-barrel protein [Gilvimarinus xylanilyticus]MCP8899127.1 outer membrane beta-barrel protein [Gilvimarinus xylanilyticus]
MKCTLSYLAGLMTLVLGTSAPAWAQDPTVQLKLGAFAQTTDATVSSGNDTGGTDLSLQTLGHDDSQTNFWVSGKWQFAERWQLWGNISQFDSEGSVDENFYFEFGDLDIPADIDSVEGELNIDSTFNADLYIVNLGYELYQSPALKIDAGLGIHVVEFGLSMDVELQANDRTESLGSESSEVTAPLPNIVLFGQWNITERIEASTTLGWLSLNYDDYDGELTALELEIDYALTDHFGIGAGYRYIDYGVTKHGERLTSSFDSLFEGPTVYAVMRF